MRGAGFACSTILTAALLPWPGARAQDIASSSSKSAQIDAAFARFWAADSPEAAARLADPILKSGVTFEEAFRRLKAGRPYTAQKSGVVFEHNKTADGFEHNYAINVPGGYDPARRYPVRFQLHGGIGVRTSNKPRGTGEIGPLAGVEQIYVLPYAWDEAPWWSDDQILNLNAIVDAVKRSYNVDENRVALAGVSDGATGAYYVAMRDTTPFASFLPLNGFVMVLAAPDVADGLSFPNNLRNKPLFVINGGQDPLYPTSLVEPFTRYLMDAGVAIDYHPQPDAEHNTLWWPEMKDPFEKFVAAHPRNPYPEKLTWEAAGAKYNRDHWLVLDQFGAARGERGEMDDVNVVKPGALAEILAGDFGDAAAPELKTSGLLFKIPATRGRVDLTRTGNTIQASTRGVTQFTLLLSPDQFDFSQPLTVIANGREVFRGRVEPSLATLLKWAARDNDRTMLFAAELTVKLPQ